MTETDLPLIPLIGASTMCFQCDPYASEVVRLLRINRGHPSHPRRTHAFLHRFFFVFVMYAPKVFFSDLKSGKCSSVVEARLLRSWEAKNVKRDGELMWVDMLLIDVNATMMQVTINANRLSRFRSKLAAGTMYTVSGFDAAAMRDFLVSSFDLKRFYLWLHAPIIETRMQEPTLFRVMAADSRSPRDGKHIEVLGYFNPLPGQDGGKRMGLKFYRINVQEFMVFFVRLNSWNIVGEVRDIKTTYNEETQSTQRTPQTTVCLSVFDGLAMLLYNKLVTSSVEPESYVKGLGVSASDTFLNLGSVTLISELNDYVLNSPPQQCSLTSRRFNSHGMVEENRGEAGLLRARPIIDPEMTTDEPTVIEDGHSVKKTRIEESLKGVYDPHVDYSYAGVFLKFSIIMK
ncbi:hypothetical protein HID58_090290 [Brassica napus]|uniref:DUF223 domain-containing protein n=1 Tax=Brassica napus TaxID=3708 RepID=A0ABQ7X654_BRANA|nr:hypothetical protein HID58_090290 [Brassica napus]